MSLHQISKTFGFYIKLLDNLFSFSILRKLKFNIILIQLRQDFYWARHSEIRSSLLKRCSLLLEGDGCFNENIKSGGASLKSSFIIENAAFKYIIKISLSSFRFCIIPSFLPYLFFRILAKHHGNHLRIIGEFQRII